MFKFIWLQFHYMDPFSLMVVRFISVDTSNSSLFVLSAQCLSTEGQLYYFVFTIILCYSKYPVSPRCLEEFLQGKCRRACSGSWGVFIFHLARCWQRVLQCGCINLHAQQCAEFLFLTFTNTRYYQTLIFANLMDLKWYPCFNFMTRNSKLIFAIGKH